MQTQRMGDEDLRPGGVYLHRPLEVASIRKGKTSRLWNNLAPGGPAFGLPCPPVLENHLNRFVHATS